MAEQYPNRTDLSNAAKKVAKMAPKGQTYGKATAQLQSQSQVPMGSGDITTPQPETSLPRVSPGSLGAFDRPTERPNEPITSGAPFGEGPTPAQLGMPTALGGPTPLDEIRALYQAYPNDDLAALIESAINRTL